jgi:hypothetical protein
MRFSIYFLFKTNNVHLMMPPKKLSDSMGEGREGK